MNDDLIQLASAYLDGDVTAAERAQVDADAVLLAEVERLRQVRAVLGANEIPAISTRERHLAAALDAWDRLPTIERSGASLDATPADAAAAAGAASVTAPTPLGDRRKRKAARGNGWMLTAAAGLVLVLGAGLVVRGLNSGSDDTSDLSSADAPLNQAEQRSGSAAVAEDAAEELFAEDDAAADAAASEPVAEIPADDLSFTDDSGVVIDAPPDDDIESLESLEDLGLYAADALNAPISGQPATEPTEAAAGETNADAQDDPSGADDAEAAAEETAVAPAETFPPAFSDCGLVDTVVGPAIWNVDGGLFVADSHVIVGIDTASQEAVAYIEDGCNEVARTPLPTP